MSEMKITKDQADQMVKEILDERAVECMIACHGIENPPEEIPKLIKDRERLVEALKFCRGCVTNPHMKETKRWIVESGIELKIDQALASVQPRQDEGRGG